MKTIFTLLMLPLIVLICFFSVKLYISGEYVAAYTLVMTWFLSVTIWIKNIGLLMKRPSA